MNPYEILRTQLAGALEPITKGSTESIVDIVLRTLEQQRIVSFSKVGDIKLLSSVGRVFVAVLENPDMTQRAIGKYLGMQETQVHKALKQLEKAGLLATTNLGRKKMHEFAGPEVLRHPDISRFFDVIAQLVKENFAKGKR